MKQKLVWMVFVVAVLVVVSGGAWLLWAKVNDPNVTVAEFDRVEVQQLTAQVERLIEHRNAMVAYLARKHGLNAANYNYDVQGGRFVPKELKPQ